MAINLASKYDGKIAEKFTKESYVAGNASTEYDFAGVKSVSIYTPQTVDLNDYKRTGENRFGTPVEMQDTVQEIELSQDKGFSITIDRGNNVDQMNTKTAAKMLNMQIKERVVPFMDRYALKRWAQQAGTIEGLNAAPTRDTIVEKIFDGAKALDNALVPDQDRIMYIPTTYYNMLRLSKEFLAVDNLAEKALSKGYVGMIADMKVIKVPDAYMPSDLYFLITFKGAVLNPNKIKTMRVLSEVAGIDGNVLEGRNYFDAFVLEAKAGGVYAAVASASVLAVPKITVTSGSAAITAVSGVTFKYTLDGSDPRYSKNAQVYASAVTLAAGQVMRAVATKDGSYMSAVAEAVNA